MSGFIRASGIATPVTRPIIKTIVINVWPQNTIIVPGMTATSESSAYSQ